MRLEGEEPHVRSARIAPLLRNLQGQKSAHVEAHEAKAARKGVPQGRQVTCGEILQGRSARCLERQVQRVHRRFAREDLDEGPVAVTVAIVGWDEDDGRRRARRVQYLQEPRRGFTALLAHRLGARARRTPTERALQAGGETSRARGALGDRGI